MVWTTKKHGLTRALERTAAPLRSSRVKGFDGALWLSRVTGVITAGRLSLSLVVRRQRISAQQIKTMRKCKSCGTEFSVWKGGSAFSRLCNRCLSADLTFTVAKPVDLILRVVSFYCALWMAMLSLTLVAAILKVLGFLKFGETVGGLIGAAILGAKFGFGVMILTAVYWFGKDIYKKVRSSLHRTFGTPTPKIPENSSHVV